MEIYPPFAETQLKIPFRCFRRGYGKAIRRAHTLLTSDNRGRSFCHGHSPLPRIASFTVVIPEMKVEQCEIGLLNFDE